MCVVVNKDFKVLTVTRRYTDTLCLPGGKLDPYETVYEAARRECYEETGITLDTKYLTPVYSEIVLGKKDGVDYYCTAFVYNLECDMKFFDGKPLPEKWSYEDGITARFSEVDDLLEGDFAEFNAKVFENMIKLKGSE